MVTRYIVQEVREMLERHWTASDIAHKMHLDIALVTNIINNYLS